MSAGARVHDAVERVPVGGAGLDVARGVHGIVLRSERSRAVADVLHGTWLGHPLHPVLTDLTIGAWFLGGVFDAFAEVNGDPAARRAGDRLAAIGTAAAVPTALTGLTDFSTLPRGASRAGTLHALLNGAGLGLYALSLVERRSGDRRRGLAFSFAAQGLALASAWLGGDLVYRHRVGVDHTERFTGPAEWTAVLEEDALPDGQARRVETEDGSVLLYRDGGTLHAIGAVCGHAGGPLEQGEFRGCEVRCPWHDSVFDLRDGSVRHGPATGPQPSFEARSHDGRIEIRLREAGGRG